MKIELTSEPSTSLPMSLNPYSNGMTIECFRIRGSRVHLGLNPYSNGMTIEYTIRKTVISDQMGLNPYSNGMTIELRYADYSGNDEEVLILILME